MNHRIALMLVMLGGCSATQASDIEIPAAGRSMWDHCHSAMDTWCTAQSQGDLTLDRDCHMNTTREYSQLRDEAARRQYLTAHRCTM